MSTIAQLLVVVEGNSAGLNTALTKASASVSTFGTGAQKMIGQVIPLATTAATLGVVAFAASSVKAAADFEAAFTRIDAISNATTAQISEWRDVVLELGGETAQAPNDLADALYFLASASLDASQITETLEMSAKAAAVGLGSTTDIAKITANALNAYADSGLTAAQVTDTLVAAVREGSAEPAEFAAALGRILPIAAKAGVEFNEVTASLAGLSNIGLDVNEGVTAMRGVLQALVAPTQQSQEALTALGITTDQLRNSLSQDGLISTLRMLEEATGGNIEKMRDLVPNVRALTGVFGLTGQEAKKMDEIFRAVADSAGSLDDAFAATTKGTAFQLQKAFNDIRIAGEKVGITVLPVLADLASIFADVVPLAIKLGAVFLAYKAFTFLPLLLQGIALGLADIGVAAGASAGLTTLSVGLAGLSAGVLLPIVGALYLLATGISAIGSSADRADLRAFVIETNNLVAAAEAYNLTDSQLRAVVADSNRALAAQGNEFTVNARAVQIAAQEHISYSDALVLVGQELDRVRRKAELAEQRVTNFAHMTDAEMKSFKSSVMSSVESAVGSLDTLAGKWTITSRQAVKAMDAMANKSGEIAKDFRKLDKEAIPEEFNAFLKIQGPDAVHAYETANKKGQAAILADWKVFDKNMSTIQSGLAASMKQDGTKVGQAMDEGVIIGIQGGTPAVAAAAAAMAHRAVQAAMDALGAQSPSKVMHKVGTWFIQGFANGITDTLGTLTDAIHNAVSAGIAEAKDQTSRGLDDLAAQTMQQVDALKADLRQAKMFEGLSSDLAATIEDLQNQIDDFSSSISSGFESFDLVGGALELPQQLHDNLVASVQAELDAAQLAGESADVIASLEADLAAAQAQSITATTADYTTYLQDQLAATQEFAAGLTQLSAMGLNTATLTDIANQGVDAQPLIDALLLSPDLIASFNATQSAITDVTNSTIDTLVNDVFGKQLAKAGREAEALSEQLAQFADDLQAQKWGNDVNDVLRALEKLQKQLDEFDTGQGSGGGGGGGGTAQPGYAPPLDPTHGAGAQPTMVVTQNVYGDVLTEQELTNKLHSNLLKKQTRNGTLGFH